VHEASRHSFATEPTTNHPTFHYQHHQHQHQHQQYHQQYHQWAVFVDALFSSTTATHSWHIQQQSTQPYLLNQRANTSYLYL